MRGSSHWMDLLDRRIALGNADNMSIRGYQLDTCTWQNEKTTGKKDVLGKEGGDLFTDSNLGSTFHLYNPDPSCSSVRAHKTNGYRRRVGRHEMMRAWLNTGTIVRRGQDDKKIAQPMHHLCTPTQEEGARFEPPTSGGLEKPCTRHFNLTMRRCTVLCYNITLDTHASLTLTLHTLGACVHTTMPIRTRPSLAASLRAAFLVPPLPRPKTSPSTSTRTAQIGVVMVPSASHSS